MAGPVSVHLPCSCRISATDSPMPRVRPLPEEEWQDIHRDVLARLAPDDPVDPLIATLLHVPEMVEAVLPMTRYVIEESSLSPRDRHLLSLRTAWLERSDAVWAGLAALAGAEFPDMARLVGQSDRSDLADQQLLRLADELVLNTSVTDSTWSNLVGDHAGVTWVMDAVETVAHASFLCCLARSFDVPPAYSSWALPPADRPPVPRRQPALTRARIEPIQGKGIAVLRTFARHPVMAEARSAARRVYYRELASIAPRPRDTDFAYWLGLPGRIRVGQACR